MVEFVASVYSALLQLIAKDASQMKGQRKIDELLHAIQPLPEALKHRAAEFKFFMALIPSYTYGSDAEMMTFRRSHKVLFQKFLGYFAAASLPVAVSNFPVVLRLFFDDVILAGTEHAASAAEIFSAASQQHSDAVEATRARNRAKVERGKNAKVASAVAPLDSASIAAIAPSNQGALGTEQMMQVMMQEIALLKEQVAKISWLELDHAESKQQTARIPQLELEIATLKQTVAELSVDVRNFSVAASRITLRSLSLVCWNVTDADLDASLQSGLGPQFVSAASVLGAAADQLDCRPSC